MVPASGDREGEGSGHRRGWGRGGRGGRKGRQGKEGRNPDVSAFLSERVSSPGCYEGHWMEAERCQTLNPKP